jgi:hypothetical protein
MNQNHSMVTNNNVSGLWNSIVRVYRILSVAGISIIMILLSWFTLFNVGQVTDAIIALGNFGSLHHFVIFSLIGILWAFFVWYWARVFYYIEYQKRTDLKDYEKVIIKHTPRILGALALLIIGFAFLIQAPQCQIVGRPNPIRIIGIVFLILAIIFIIVINLRRKIFNLKPLGELQASLQPKQGVVPMTNLPDATKKILIITTIIVIILLVALIISPIYLTMYMGDGVTVLISCFCIWLPLLYWVHYFSLKLDFPLFLVLAGLIAVFSFFNGNKNVRLVNTSADPGIKITNYYNLWYPKAGASVSATDTRKPLVIVLSEGGGIRAAYWSAQFLARIHRDYPHFRNYLFCISGVSGGSFGATVFDSLLDYYDHHSQESQGSEPPKSVMQQNITDIVGKDFLSPTIACMFTREAVQLMVPFPIHSFDHAKVFEETWELTWQNVMMGDSTFGVPFLSLWRNNSIPPVFLNVTQVENGYPVVVSNLKLDANLISKPDSAPMDNQSDFYLPRDFYNDILNDASSDVRISTASLLSARFPYVGPAGTLTGKNGNNIGLVDGGYFDNTGANTAYQVLLNLKEWYEKEKNLSIYRTNIKPVIVYLKNGMQTADKKTSGQTMLYQLFAPIDTFMQVRDAYAVNNLLKLNEFINLYQGEFITYSLQKDENDQTAIPLGWALSRKAQMEIDNRVEEINIGELGKYLK